MEKRIDQTAGGMGEVYSAVETATNRRVAIKVLKPELAGDAEVLKRFEREWLALKEIAEKNNVVDAYDYFEVGGNYYLVMEYLRGKTIKELIKEHPDGMPWDEVAEYMIDILSGLQHIHNQGIVHRDIKPANLMVLPDDTVKVLDLGIVRLVDPRTGDPELTVINPGRPAPFLGTLAYMSPEQFHGQTADYRSDIYNAGLVMYEMLTGKRFPAEGKPPPLSGKPTAPTAELSEILDRALAIDPRDRFSSARKFRERLQRLLETRRALPPSPGPAPVADGKGVLPPAKRRSWLLMGSVAVGIAGVGVAFYLMADKDHRNPSSSSPPREVVATPPLKNPALLSEVQELRQRVDDQALDLRKQADAAFDRMRDEESRMVSTGYSTIQGYAAAATVVRARYAYEHHALVYEEYTKAMERAKPDIDSADRLMGQAKAALDSGQPTEAWQGLARAKVDLLELGAVPQRVQGAESQREEKALAEMEGRWGNSTCSIVASFVVSAADRSIHIREKEKEAREKILGITKNGIIETEVETPANKRGTIYRYTIQGGSLRVDNATNPEASKNSVPLKRC